MRVCVLGILSHVDTLHPALLTTVSWELCYNVLCSRIKVSNYSTIFGCLLSLSYLRWHYYESAKTAQFLMEGLPIYKKKCLKRKCYKTFARVSPNIIFRGYCGHIYWQPWVVLSWSHVAGCRHPVCLGPMSTTLQRELAATCIVGAASPAPRKYLHTTAVIFNRKSNEGSRRFHNHWKGPYFSWLKAPTSAFTLKTLLRHYAKQMLTPQ